MERILLLTNQLEAWAGSETIIVELAEHFTFLGWNVSVFANFLKPVFLEDLVKGGVRVIEDPAEVRIAEYEFIYCQHQVLSLFVEQLSKLETSTVKPKIVYGHLSPYEPLEYPGDAIEDWFADVIVCNSEETKRRIVEFGFSPNTIDIYPNPAPDVFFKKKYPAHGQPELLVVSNHIPKEVKTALNSLIRLGVKVQIYGDEYTNRRVVPSDFLENSMVLTIGKTVQFAIASDCPVYIYDRFGGPGWLTADNFDRAAEYNFSGRCTRKKRTSDALCSEILEGYRNILLIKSELGEKKENYRLSAVVKRVFFDSAASSKARKASYAMTESQCKIFYEELTKYRLRLKLKRRRYQLIRAINSIINWSLRQLK